VVEPAKVVEAALVAITPSPSNNAAVNATPVARRAADQLGVDLSQVKGTGADGQITKPDVESFAAARSASAVTAPVQTGRIIASPAAKKAALDQGIDLHQVKGTGPEGRIVLADVASQADKAVPAAIPVSVVPVAAPAVVAPVTPAKQTAPVVSASGRKPLSRIRNTIAQRMTQSKTTVPHFYITVQVKWMLR